MNKKLPTIESELANIGVPVDAVMEVLDRHITRLLDKREIEGRIDELKNLDLLNGHESLIMTYVGGYKDVTERIAQLEQAMKWENDE